MNRLRRALLLDQDEQVGKKRFSLFNGKSRNELVVLPRLNISSPCVEYPLSPASAIEIGNEHISMYRPRSVHIESSSSMKQTRCRSTKLSINQETSSDFDKESYLQLGMNYHEKGELEKATHYWRLSSETGSPLGLFFYGIALRHGWVCLFIYK